MVWDGQRFVAVGHTFAYSEDGERWRRLTSQDGGDLDAVTWSGERYVAVGHDGLIMHSTDGDRWQQASEPAVPFRAARPDDGPHRIYYYFGGTIMYSSDGDRWEQASEIATYDLLRDVTWGDGRFVAVGWNGTIVVSP